MPDAEGELVQLYVYDLSGGMAAAFSPMLLGRTIEAIFHTSIVVGGVELYYGGGINVARPGATPFGRPVQTLELGRTQLPEEVREALLADLSEKYTPEAYSLWSNNCNNFSNELAELLCGRGIPEHITGLPAEVLSTPFGQMIAPMLSGLEQQMRSMRAQACRPHTDAASAAAPAALVAPAGGVQPPTEPAAAAVPAAAPAATEAAPAEEAAAKAVAGDEGAALHAAEVEIEAAVAAGMMQEAEEALHSLQLEAAAGQQPAVAVAAPAAAAAESAQAAAPARAAMDAKLAMEVAVEAEFERLLATGVAEHEAQALALEAVAAAAGAATDNPAQHGQGIEKET